MSSLREERAMLKSRLDELLEAKKSVEFKIDRWQTMIANNDPAIENIHSRANDMLSMRQDELANINAQIEDVEDELLLIGEAAN